KDRSKKVYDAPIAALVDPLERAQRRADVRIAADLRLIPSRRPVMPFYIYGKNARTGEIAKRIYSDASSETEARQQAETQGLEVRARGACAAPAVVSGSQTAALPAIGAVRPSPAAAALASFREELGYATDSTYATYALIALNMLVFGLMCVSGVSPRDPTI